MLHDLSRQIGQTVEKGPIGKSQTRHMAGVVFVHSTLGDDVAHKGFYATNTLIALRFWWPHMRTDIAWFIRTCQLCQLQQT